MSDSHIFFGGVAIFSLMLLGLLLTSYEFKKMSRPSAIVVPASKPNQESAVSRQTSASRAAHNPNR